MIWPALESIPYPDEISAERAEGHLTPIEDSAAPIRDDENKLVGVVLVFRDVTAERKSQELVRRSRLVVSLRD
jgi:PAS domain S-box-containing protein